MTNTMPMLTDKQREEAITRCEYLLTALTPGGTDYLTVQIALASLTAEPFAWHHGDITEDYLSNLSSVKTGSNVMPLYTAPPVPAMKLPEKVSCDGFNPKEWGEARNLGQCEGWNACIYESKRLNGVTE